MPLQINDLAADARGVGRAAGKVVFVADALPGEEIRYRPLRQHRRYDEGQLCEILRPAPERVQPRCPHFGVCGGCALQHLSAQGQREFKHQQVLNTLERIGRVTPQQVLPPIGADLWQYRRRARLAVKHVSANGTTLVGFRERGSGSVAALERCDILVGEVGEHIVDLQAVLNDLSIREQIPQIEVAAGDNAITLVLRVLCPPTELDRVKLERFSAASGLWFYLQPGGPATITPLLENTPALYYDLPRYDLRIEFEPTDFVQINAEANKQMVDQALALLALDAGDHVLDLFSGVGNFSLPLARQVRRVTAVEGDTGLVARARANVDHNGLNNCIVLRDDLFAANSSSNWPRADFNKVLLDPPRAGAREVLPQLAKRAPSHIVYCSCHPATLARDAAVLVNEYGYRLAAAGTVDMFPHTAHVEAMALLVRT